jgi:aminoglycoside phosphotransferase (APT) family kinase protein
MTIDAAAQGRLTHWLSGALAGEMLIVALSRLSGGAIQQNWLVTGQLDGRPFDAVLRKDAPATISASHSRWTEFSLMRHAHASGVLVPKPLAFCEDATVLGGPFALIAKANGIGLGPRVVKTVSDDAGGPLAHELGRQLALIHATKPSAPLLALLGDPPEDQARDDIAWMRDALDAMQMADPALEWSLRHAERHAPDPVSPVLIHRDFRTGNYLVADDRLTAILDWEFAGWGDPASDIGWFCARCWRFSRPDREAGGIGARACFLAGYAEGGGVIPDPARVAYWERMAHLRWAVIALQQGERHASGLEPSLEHAITGRMAAELALAALEMSAPTGPAR